MSLIRLLPAGLHAVADYAVGSALIIIALVVGGSSGAVATGVVVGATVLLVSLITNYPLGAVKILPFQVHSAGDYLAAALLLAAPFTLHFNHGDTGLTAVYIVGGLAVLGVSLVTNYQWNGAVRRPVTVTA
jgi:hypothetical protein